MKRFKTIACFVFAFVTILVTNIPDSRATTTITSWSLGTGVSDSSAGPPSSNGQFSDSPQNPFQSTQHGYLPNATKPIQFSSAQFLASWLVAESLGQFDVTFNQQINGRKSTASTSGYILLASDTDLFMNFSAIMNFASDGRDEAGFELSYYITTPDGEHPPLWGGAPRGGPPLLRDAGQRHGLRAR